jgi:hypothetical protein
MRYSSLVTARQIIEEYRKLPPQEQEEVRAELVHHNSPQEPRFLSRQEARQVSKSLFVEYDDLFRKLAK